MEEQDQASPNTIDERALDEFAMPEDTGVDAFEEREGDAAAHPQAATDGKVFDGPVELEDLTAATDDLLSGAMAADMLDDSDDVADPEPEPSDAADALPNDDDQDTAPVSAEELERLLSVARDSASDDTEAPVVPDAVPSAPDAAITGTDGGFEDSLSEDELARMVEGDRLADEVQEMLDSARPTQAATSGSDAAKPEADDAPAAIDHEPADIDDLDAMLAQSADDMIAGAFESIDDVLAADARTREQAAPKARDHVDQEEREPEPVEEFRPTPAAPAMAHTDAPLLEPTLSERLWAVARVVVARLVAVAPGIARAICEQISRPIDRLPDEYRQLIGLAGVGTAVLGIITLLGAVLFIG